MVTGCSPINKLTVPALSENKSDKLRFVVNAGKNANYDDRVQWPVTVNMFVPTNGSAKCEYAANGALSADVELGDIGDTVTVTAAPADGY